MITFIRCGILTITKREDLLNNLPELKELALSLSLQLLASFFQMSGICILFLLAFPEIASSKVSLITCCAAIFPGLVKFVGRMKPNMTGKDYLLSVADIIAIGLQLGALAYFTFSIWESHSRPWSLPLGLLLTSVGWWTVWLSPSEERQGHSYLRRIGEMNDKIEYSDYECIMDVVMSRLY